MINTNLDEQGSIIKRRANFRYNQHYQLLLSCQRSYNVLIIFTSYTSFQNKFGVSGVGKSGKMINTKLDEQGSIINDAQTFVTITLPATSCQKL